MELIPHSLTAWLTPLEIRSLIVFSTAMRGHHTFSALPPMVIPDASPKAISRRTSYLPTRLEFLPYPQVIRGRFNERRFGPPVDFTPPSTCSWIDRRASGLCQRTKRPIQARFHYGSASTA